MEVQWYPGQMAKAKRLLRENLKLVDAVIEVLDARIPASSQNPDIRQILQNRPVVAVLTRPDLADPEETEKWLQLLGRQYFIAAAVNARMGTGIKRLFAGLKSIPKRRKHKRRPLRLMVAGIPNVGKSSLINRLIGRNAAITGDKPGVTTGKQWIRLPGDLELLDTPGLLWPKIANKEQAFCLAAVGSIKDEIINLLELGHELIKYFERHAQQNIYQRYKIETEIKDPNEIMIEIGKRRGCLRKGGEVDLEAAARILIKDFREGRLGRITLEKAAAVGEENEGF
ncbi:MAG: ribosome biogenesis GTPase YlqF [Firmicutes bacterium]|nr:ribosome biogenesis GTPase YlqF [Bacillota bacterium]